MLKVDIHRDARKFLARLSPKHERQIVERIVALTTDPFAQDTKQLHGYVDLYRADTGEYRVVYCVDKDTLFVLLVGKRNDDEVYKKIERKLR